MTRFAWLVIALSLAGCGGPDRFDVEMGSSPDLAIGPLDLSAHPSDAAVAADLAQPDDLAAPDDLATPPDLTIPVDLRRVVDLAKPVDLAGGGGCNPACPINGYCQLPMGCAGPGQCAPKPMVCPQICSMNCGCDGHQYCNACLAAVAGVSINHAGACP